MPQAIEVTDIVGKTFGRWTPKYELTQDLKHRRYFHCVCVCGKERGVTLTGLRTGKSTSCGCYASEVKSRVHKKHGMYGTSEYQAYHGMIRRCTDPKRHDYPNYGGRGIKVCERWLEGFENFFADMGRKLVSTLTIERRDVNGNYCPENCYWASKEQQQRNTRRSNWYTYKGEAKTLPQWAELFKISQNNLWQRIEVYGWSVERALEEPVTKRGLGASK